MGDACTDESAERLMVRHGLESIWRGRLYRESYAPNCWLTPAEPVPFRLTHDGETIGHVTALAPSGQWHHASFVIDDPTPETRERVKVGARVSLGAQSLRRYENTDPNVVRHTLCRLEEIALVDDGAIAEVGAGQPRRPSRARTGIGRRASRPRLRLERGPRNPDRPVLGEPPAEPRSTAR